jgi:putative transposase
MKELLLTLLHLAAMIAKLCGPGGVRAVIAENLLLKQQLIVLRRARQRAPNLALRDRLICGWGSLFLSPRRIRKVAIGVRPSTLLAFHQALVRRKYQQLFSSSRCPKKPGPKGPSEALIQAIVELKSRNPRVRLSADCAHHLAHVRRRHRQERRLPRAMYRECFPRLSV